MTLNKEDLSGLVAPQWREAFWKFVDTGEGSPEFLAYLDHDENCQRALDQVLTAQADELHRFGKALAAQGGRPEAGFAGPGRRRSALGWRPVVTRAALAALIVLAVALGISTASFYREVQFARQRQDYLLAQLSTPPTALALNDWEAATRAAAEQAGKDLENPDPDVRRLAATTLGKLGPAAKTALPTIVSRLKERQEQEEDDGARAALTQAIVTIDPHEAAGGALNKEDLDRLLKNAIETREVGSAYMPPMGDGGAPGDRATFWRLLQEQAVQDQLTKLRSEDRRERLAAARALGKMGPGGKKAVPELMARFREEKDEGVRSQVAEALKDIDLLIAAQSA